MTSPVPETMNDASRSATARSASSRRSTRSIRQSLASSTAARGRLPRYSSSLASNLAKRVKASAAAPAKPARTRPWYTLRTLRAPALTMVWPMETWPSPARATRPWCLTHATVVARKPPVSDVMGSFEIVSVGARMRPIVHLHQVLRAHVRVALGRAEAAVAEELLDESQIRAFAEHMGGEAVAKGVGRDAAVNPRRARPALDDPMHPSGREAAPAGVGGERAPPLAPHAPPRLAGPRGQ